ncbi:hypothetical protein [Nocardioides sp. TF02-7]|nr:hypothetical protein [Nocardioides sp. TF02-7]
MTKAPETARITRSAALGDGAALSLRLDSQKAATAKTAVTNRGGA